MDDNYVGNQIRKVREKYGYTQEKVAELMGITSTHFSNIERGVKRLTTKRMLQLCEIFDKPSDYFVSGSAQSNNLSERLIWTIKGLDEKRLKLVELYIETIDNADI